jgi:tetratricopeptide (TPR) repeat protein
MVGKYTIDARPAARDGVVVASGFPCVLLTLLVAIAICALVGCDRDEPADTAATVPAQATPVAREFADYAGSASCRECHAAQFDPWAHSHHGLAERALDPKRDDVAFEPARTVAHGSQESAVRKRGAGLGARGAGDGRSEYFVETLGPDGKVKSFSVDRVIGEKPLWQFIVDSEGAADGKSDGGSALAKPVAPHDDAGPVAPNVMSTGPIGRQQVLELCYDPAKRDWFNVYGDEDRKPGEWGHWTGRGMNWNSQCASCHNTRVKKNYDAATDTFATTMAEPTVSCEACHGPMKGHVDWQRVHGRGEVRISPNPESRLPNPAPDPTLRKFTSTQWLAICGSCHSRRGELNEDFVPGDSFFDHFSLAIADLSEVYYADGQVREENYEFASFLSSRMYASGVTCLHCHDPHKARPLEQGNALCMKCHNGSFPKSVRIDPATHTFHAAESTGSQCVNCHMPQTVYMQRHSRHDHGFTIPDPLLTKRHGIPNACNRCHTDKDADWSLAAVEKWYGEKMNRPSRRRAQVVAAARAGDANATGALLAMLADKDNVFWQASAAALLGQAPLLERRDVRGSLAAATKHAYPLVRERAVDSLGMPARAGYADAAAAINGLLGDPVRGVRVAAAWELRTSIDENTPAAKDLFAHLRHIEDRADGVMQQGVWHFDRGNTARAVTLFERAVAWDPGGAPIRENLAMAYSLQDRPADAVRQMQQAVRIEPRHAEFWHKLGLAWGEVGDLKQAVASFEKAVEVEPRHARAWYNLGSGLAELGRASDAIRALRKAEELDARNADAPFVIAEIYARHRRIDDAREALGRALRIDPRHAKARGLMAELGTR